MSLLAKFISALLVYLVLRFFFFWLAAGLFFAKQPDRAGVAADVLALACAWAVWHFWPRKPRAAGASEATPTTGLGPTYRSRVLLASMIAGTVGFAGGFFGPMVFSPQSNQGPLLGILVTGPLGFMLGPAIGVATMIRRNTLAALPRAAAWLALQFVLAGAFYWLFAEVLAVLGFGMMLLTALVGVVVFVHALRRLSPSKHVIAAGAILLGGVALMLVLSAFPPVMAPWWGKAPGPDSPLPAFAFIMDPGFATNRNVPRYTIDRNLWAVEMLFVAAWVGIALMMVKIKAQAGATATRG